MFDFADEQYTGESQYSELQAGLRVPAVLTGVEVDDESGDLIFSFKGTEKGDTAKGIAPNTGTLNHRVWANSFDKEHEYYNANKAIYVINATKHILKAYLPVEQIEAMKADNWLGFVSLIKDAMKEEVYANKPIFLKVILNNKNRSILPTFPDFISSELMPKSFTLQTKVNPNTGLPYERITPIEMPTAPAGGSDFGAVEQAAGTAGTASGDAPTPAFG